MDNPEKKPIIGILGGMCSGKSTAAVEFAKLGCKVIDADKIAHEVLEEKAIKQKVIAHFGDELLDPSGKIDRTKLADIVFADAEELSRLNDIIHPPVIARTEQLIEQYNHQPNVKAIVLDMPLLMEVGLHKRCNTLIFVESEEELRAERARKTGIFDENQFKIRENFQISLDSKQSIADNVISNNSSFSELVKQVFDIYSYIMDK